MSSYLIHAATIRTVQGDITSQAVDAVVNAANNNLMGGGGVDGAIHRRGGPAILEACRMIRRTKYPDGLPTGLAVITTGGELPAQYVIHTVGPVWTGGRNDEDALLSDCYRNSLEIAKTNDLRTIALPSISTGAYGFPLERAAPIALEAVQAYLEQNPAAFTEIRFVLFSPGDLAVYEYALTDLAPTSTNTEIRPGQH